MVPHDATAAEFAQDLDDGVRSRPQRRHVAKTDDLVHAGSADLREHGAQCHLIRMDIRNQRNTRHRSDLGLIRCGKTTDIPRFPGVLRLDSLLIRLREQHVRTANRHDRLS
jgi:hypothetical protein